MFQQRRETYFSEQRYTKPKEVFRMFAEILRARFGDGEFRLLDVGCATGELIYFLKQLFPQARFSGIDNAPDFIEAAQNKDGLENCRLKVGDALTWNEAGPYDVVTCFGVAGIFDDFVQLFDNLRANLAPGGLIAVQALFNPDDIDVRSSYRDNQNNVDWNLGFNVFSRKRIETWCEMKHLDVKWHDVVIPQPLPKKPQTPHRAHTIALADGRHAQINGLCMILPDTLGIFSDRNAVSQ